MYTLELKEYSTIGVLNREDSTMEIKLVINGEDVPLQLVTVSHNFNSSKYKNNMGVSRPTSYENLYKFTNLVDKPSEEG